MIGPSYCTSLASAAATRSVALWSEIGDDQLSIVDLLRGSLIAGNGMNPVLPSSRDRSVLFRDLESELSGEAWVAKSPGRLRSPYYCTEGGSRAQRSEACSALGHDSKFDY